MAHVHSAGILLYRCDTDGIQVWIAHMGGPFWARKDARAWTIPKGEYAETEEPLLAAKREFAEEIGVPVPEAEYIRLGVFGQASGKKVTVFIAEAPTFSVEKVVSNTFELQWPPRSGKMQNFPEIDRAGWFPLRDAREKVIAGQVAALDELQRLVSTPSNGLF